MKTRLQSKRLPKVFFVVKAKKFGVCAVPKKEQEEALLLSCDTQ